MLCLLSLYIACLHNTIIVEGPYLSARQIMIGCKQFYVTHLAHGLVWGLAVKGIEEEE